MKETYLDLRNERCPMALLLAKRQSMQLSSQETLVILSKDRVSIKDMVQYFQHASFNIAQVEEVEYTTLLITKKEINPCLK